MRNQHELVQLIDRYRLGDSRRLTMGVSLPRDMRRIDSALVVVEGRGKCLRLRWVEHRAMPLAESVREPALRLLETERPELADWSQTRIDLAGQLAIAVRDAIALFASSEKNLLAICVSEPGIWMRDYDGVPGRESLVEPAVLSELTGVSVIDDFPRRDMACGGRGWPIEPLAWWLMFGDRSTPVARHPRVIVDCEDECRLTWLPPSDGLDRQLPEVRCSSLPGNALVAQLIAAAPKTAQVDARSDKVEPALLRALEQFMSDHTAKKAAPGDFGRQVLPATLEIVQRGVSAARIRATFEHFHATRLKEFIDAHRIPDHGPIELVAGGDWTGSDKLRDEISRQIDTAVWLELADINYRPPCLAAATAAVMGLMHIDQMPATVPWLTGARLPRIAGRLTPGNPANYRRLVMEMGDSRPPVMKLRDAV